MDDEVTAAWFQAARPAVGAYVLARGEYGHGTHHAEGVFYVDGPRLFEVIPADAHDAYLRHQRRVAKQARSTKRPSQRNAGSTTS